MQCRCYIFVHNSIELIIIPKAVKVTPENIVHTDRSGDMPNWKCSKNHNMETFS